MDTSTIEDSSALRNSLPPLSLPSNPSLSLPPFSPNSVIPTTKSYSDIENEPPTQVLPWLYVGNAQDANNLELLSQLGISYVLSATNIVPNRHSYPASTNTAPTSNTPETKSSSSTNSESQTITILPNNNENNSFQTKLVQVSDNLCENLIGRFEECFEFIGKLEKSL